MTIKAQRKSRPDRVYTAVRIDVERLARLQELAQREDRSVAAVLRRIIDRELERQKP